MSLTETREQLAGPLDKLETLLGQRDSFAVATNDQGRQSGEERLADLVTLSVTLALTDELMLAAGKRVLQKRAPTTKTDHGFADCLIWESILRLNPGDEVRLVSHDKAFISNGALHADLEREASERRIRVVGYDNLEAVLSELQRDGAPPYDATTAFEALNQALTPLHFRLIERWGLSSLGPKVEFGFEPFYTEDVNRLYITFKVRYTAGAANVAGKEYIGENYVEITGSFDWRPDRNLVERYQVDSEALITLDGSVITQNHTLITGTGHLSVGSPSTKKYELKKRLLPPSQ